MQRASLVMGGAHYNRIKEDLFTAVCLAEYHKKDFVGSECKVNKIILLCLGL